MLQIKAPGNGCGCRRRRPPSSSLALLSLVNCGRCHTGTVRRGVRVGVGCYYLCPVISSGACAELKTGKSCGSRRRQWGSVPSHSSQLQLTLLPASGPATAPPSPFHTARSCKACWDPPHPRSQLYISEARGIPRNQNHPPHTRY